MTKEEIIRDIILKIYVDDEIHTRNVVDKKNKELVFGIIESYKGQQSIGNETIVEATESANIAKALIAKIHGNRKFANNILNESKFNQLSQYIPSIIKFSFRTIIKRAKEKPIEFIDNLSSDEKEKLYDLVKKDIEEYISSIIHPISFSTEFHNRVLTEKNAYKNLNKFTIRHYTTVCPNQFGKKVKSYLTLDVEKNVLLNKSGHTTGDDWNSIGNIGDTFYSLYYDGKLASIQDVPGFIKNAKYFIEWTLDEFGECWASGDWLGKESQPISYSGNAQDVILASLLSNPIEKEAVGTKKAIMAALTYGLIDRSAYLNTRNFEIKKHGSMKFERYFDIENNRWQTIETK